MFSLLMIFSTVFSLRMVSFVLWITYFITQPLHRGHFTGSNPEEAWRWEVVIITSKLMSSLQIYAFESEFVLIKTERDLAANCQTDKKKFGSRLDRNLAIDFEGVQD